jgi:hypothetical protein
VRAGRHQQHNIGQITKARATRRETADITMTADSELCTTELNAESYGAIMRASFGLDPLQNHPGCNVQDATLYAHKGILLGRGRTSDERKT